MSIRDNVISTFDFLRRRRRAYQLAFGSPAGNEVLADLVKFCRGIETCVVPGDHDRTLMLEGRREVWLRLTNHLHLTSEQLYALHAGRNILIQDEGDEDVGSES